MSYNPMSDFMPPEARRYDPRDPDSVLVALFRYRAVENPAKSKDAGRPIFDDVEECEIRAPGSKDVKVFPAMGFSHWATDPYTGAQVKVTYAERFQRQYRQFKEHGVQTKSGTPLAAVAFLTEGRKAELRALNIYTVEQLAQVDGQELKNLGAGGRDLKNSAETFIADARHNVPNIALQARLEAAEARNQVLEQDLAAHQHKKALAEAQFDSMSDAELREFIKANTGVGVIGQPAHKTLVRMAMDARPDQGRGRSA